MSVLRQITTCPELATIVVERTSQRRSRSLDYRLATCRRHRWLADRWGGRRRSQEAMAERCGTVLDYRDYDEVVRSHSDQWMRPLTAEGPEDHNGDIAAALRAAHDWLVNAAAHRPPMHEDAVRIALDQAARVAEAVRAGLLEKSVGQDQILMTLSVAETLDAGHRGA